MKKSKTVDWEKVSNNINRIKVWICIFFLLAVLVIIFVDFVLPGNGVFTTINEMKKAAAGTYTCYEDGKPLYQIHISGNTLTKHWCRLGSEYDSRITIKMWNRKQGTFEATYAQCKLTEDGNIDFDGAFYERTAAIEISSSDWSGWDESYKSVKTTQIYTVRKGDKISLGGIADLDVTVASVADESVSFDTNTPMSDKKSGIDLNTKTTKFTLERDNFLQLITPTMDTGDVFVFKLVKAFDY